MSSASTGWWSIWRHTSVRGTRSSRCRSSCKPRFSGRNLRPTRWLPRLATKSSASRYFRSFSTWEGVHGLYLEDLYVMPEHLGTGLGKALLSYLAALAVERGYARLEWAVLDWNQPSIEFYRSLGAVAMEDWTVYRLTGESLRRLAGSTPSLRSSWERIHLRHSAFDV
jgi:hypothetical protein